MNDRELHRRADLRLKRRPNVAEQPDAATKPRSRRRGDARTIEPKPIGEDFVFSEERMRQAIEATDLAVWDFDLQTGRIHLSDSWSWLLGGERKPTDTTIQELAELVPEGDRQIVHDAIIRAVKGAGSSLCRAIHRVTRLDGSFLWVQNEGRVVERAPDGRALRMIGVNRDVTERKLLEDQLLQREARYRAVVQAAVEGFWIVDMEGRLLDVNDVYVRQSGYSREELRHMRISDLDAKESPQEVATHQGKIRKIGHDHFETEHRRKDGSIWPADIEATYWPGLNLSFVFITDATKRKRTERQIAENRQELEALQKSQIAAHTAAAFAHELNQPLGAISSYTEAALMMLDGEKTDQKQLRVAIEKSRDQALRAGNTIRTLLELLNTGSGTAEPLDVNREVREALQLTRTDTDLEFHTRLTLEPGMPCVQVNRIHLQKVLLNLFHNAVEAMREANVPDPAVIITVGTRKDQNVAQVTVRDNGPGIEPEHAGHLFETFFTTKATGIGMGLAISRSLIEANNGQLWCDPGEGPGATFHLTLPFEH